MRARRSTEEAFKSPSGRSDCQIPRVGTMLKVRERRDALARWRGYLSVPSPSYPCSCSIERFGEEEGSFDRDEFNEYFLRTCPTASAVLDLEIDDLDRITLWLDMADQVRIFFKENIIQSLPNIDVLTNGLVARLNIRNARSNITLPYVIAALVYCLQHHHSASNVLTESNISQLLKLCLSRAVYPLNGETLVNDAYHETCQCR